MRRWVFPSRPHIWGLHSGAGRLVPFPRAILSAIFPDDCHICGCALTSFDSFPVCDSCVQKVKPIRADCFCERCGVPFLNQWALDEDGICRLCLTGRRGFDACFVFGSYEKELRDLIHLFKYGRIESLAAPLAAWMLAALPADRKINGGRADCVVPVPMHWWKRWRRGFNQAERLGQEVSRALSIPMVKALRRPKPSRVQAGLASAARRRMRCGPSLFPVPARLPESPCCWWTMSSPRRHRHRLCPVAEASGCGASELLARASRPARSRAVSSCP